MLLTILPIAWSLNPGTKAGSLPTERNAERRLVSSDIVKASFSFMYLNNPLSKASPTTAALDWSDRKTWTASFKNSALKVAAFFPSLSTTPFNKSSAFLYRIELSCSKRRAALLAASFHPVKRALFGLLTSDTVGRAPSATALRNCVLASSRAILVAAWRPIPPETNSPILAGSGRAPGPLIMRRPRANTPRPRPSPKP